MCGIVGVFSNRRSDLDREGYIKRCLSTMHHRGPDSNGIWQNESYTCGFVRLSIRDLSANGSQPMLSACGKYCLSFNGEIYNASQFKNKLQQLGVDFKSTTDTEVLLNALIHFGIEKVLNEFDGMFAFSFYNSTSNTLYLARDRAGIKPLYIGKGEAHIIYSSQYDHVINFVSLRNQPLDSGVIGNYLQLGFVPDNAGAVTNTFMLPHGHYAVVTAGKLEVKQYYTYRYANNATAIDEEQLFRQSVRDQLVSDVPVGTFLSGGVDSPLISHWANAEQPINAYTVGSEDKAIDETENVQFYSKAFGINSYIKTITEQDLLNTIADNTKAYTEPFADFSSIPSLVISKYASEHVKVILSGDGPDELFWGYDRNLKMLQHGAAFNRSKALLMKDYLANKVQGKRTFINKRFFTSSTFPDFYYRSLFTYGGDEWISSIFKPAIRTAYFLEEVKQHAQNYQGTPVEIMNVVRELEMKIHLQRILLKVDRATMYHSLEARVPYLSNAVLDYSSTLSYQSCVEEGVGKYNIKKLLINKVGAGVVMKPKKGFLVPMKDWLRSELKTDVTDKLMNMPAELKVMFNSRKMEKLLDCHMNKNVDYSGIIWAMYTLVNWYHEHRNASSLTR